MKKVTEWSGQYMANKPFPHIVLDNIFDEKKLKDAVREFPPVDDPRWFSCPEIKGELRKKQAIWDFLKMPDQLALISMELNAGPFVQFLEKLTGVEPLVADPHLYGGGLHQVGPGGSLGVHCDHNINPRVLLYRRVTAILYLNDDWSEEYGGQIELWSSDMKECVVKVLPSFGRMVIFSNSETSFHGHPDPLKCPEGMTRKSIAAYFDSVKPHPSHTEEHHRALFQTRPTENLV